MEREDFGDWGDERFLGVCAEDWLEDTRLFWKEHMRERELRASDLEEEESDDAWDAENERDLSDLVRENEEEEDWVLEADDLQEWRDPELNDDYLDCEWEE
jgi:hypothetical protein